MKVLSLTTVFPNAANAGHGLFVQARLRALAARAEVRVVNPVPLFDYSHPGRRWLYTARLKRHWVDGPLRVWAPRWFYPPGGTKANAHALYWRLAGALDRLRREYKFDVIDAHFGNPEGVAAALLSRRLGVPYTVTMRGNEARDAASPALRPQLAMALRNAARVIAVSQRLANLAVSLGCDAARVVVIPNGVNTAVFHPRSKPDMRSKHGVPRDARVILSVGHLIRLKGHHRVVWALRKLREQGIDAQLVIAGGGGRDGQYDTEIRAAVADSGMGERVRFLGQIRSAELAEWMAACDVLALASSREGWPNVVHEAIACGTPVVASDVGAIPELLPSEEFGLIVPAGDDIALEGALARALQGHWDHQKIAACGGARSWEDVAGEVLAQLEQSCYARPSRECAAVS